MHVSEQPLNDTINTSAPESTIKSESPTQNSGLVYKDSKRTTVSLRENSTENQHMNSDAIGEPDKNKKIGKMGPMSITSASDNGTTLSANHTTNESNHIQYSSENQRTCAVGPIVSTNILSTEQNTPVSSVVTQTPHTGESPARIIHSDRDQRLATLTEAGRLILSAIGEDVTRDGLIKTPSRFAHAMLALTTGYMESAESILTSALFDVDTDELVVVRDIEVHSMCEHHMLPFFGKIHVGYIPNGKVVGLSKLARVVEVFSRRLQVQERLTRQIADAVATHVGALGVAVRMDATHMCMCMRGVRQASAYTTTSSYTGCFKGHESMARSYRQEFYTHLT